MKEVEFEIVDERHIKICGVLYSMGIFQGIGFAPIGMIFEITQRSEDGAVSITRHFESEAAKKDAARYRFLRQAEADLDPELEQILANVWHRISGKGIDKARMDAIVDEGIKTAAKSATEATHG